MASSMPHVSSADQAGMSSSLFYGLPRTRRKRFLGSDNFLRHIDCNQSDISVESSDDELEVATVDRNSDEESSSTESEDEVTAPTTGLKATYAKKRYTWKKTSFQQQGTCFKNDLPLPPSEPHTAKQLFDLFVSRTMLTRVVEAANKYYLQKNGTPLAMTTEELTSVLGMFFLYEPRGYAQCRQYDSTCQASPNASGVSSFGPGQVTPLTVKG
ncbi:uncharacterized protein LOC125757849 [Rhipicephalus sanguineus]|uniref:uncharacterized protein LOC125757849 n=1 Tax=Rhipicephalus sanguineus TaxID=34632 RepID=UPI0020C31137|nr:uncharacterized protein LOC125757849 [Rhipicephalus sanguineus]